MKNICPPCNKIFALSDPQVAAKAIYEVLKIHPDLEAVFAQVSPEPFWAMVDFFSGGSLSEKDEQRLHMALADIYDAL